MRENNYQIYKLNQLLNNSTRKIFITPAGRATEVLIESGIDASKISGFVDSNVTTFKNLNVIKPEVFVKIENTVLIITSRDYCDELQDMFVSKYKYEGEIVKIFLDEPLVNTIIRNKENLRIDRMDLVLGSRCSLRCKKCANLMQYYQKPHDVAFDKIIQSMDCLTHAVDEIGTVNVIGGEPFLYNTLKPVIRYLKNNNVVKYINVITNGTIYSDDSELWKELSNENILLTISNYGNLSREKNNILRKCKECNVNVECQDNQFFYDTGNLECRNRTEEQLEKVFNDCSTFCRSLFDGEFHYCPRSAHGTDLGIIPKREEDFINVFEYDSEELRKKLKKFLEKKTYIETCNYCDIRTPGYYDRTYPAAEQV